jgi:hypothetical protein
MAGRHAVVVISPEDTPEGRGRILHALVTAQGLSEAGEEVEVHFDGIGVTALTAFMERDNRFTESYGPLFDSIRPLITGACDFCTRRRFEASEAAEAFDVPLLGGEDQHHSLASLLMAGATVTTF